MHDLLDDIEKYYEEAKEFDITTNLVHCLEQYIKNHNANLEINSEDNLAILINAIDVLNDYYEYNKLPLAHLDTRELIVEVMGDPRDDI